ncbi:MAG: helix-turn-helix transcriptional regulator [Pseudomonadota bacterium]
MDNRLAVDLKVFRRRSGLSQADVAHLLAVHRSLISKFEQGVREPSMEHVCLLCLIYSIRAPGFCVAALPQFEEALADRLNTLPDAPGEQTVKRRTTITRLAEQLAASLDAYEE